MSRGVNKAILIGNVGKDPELIELKSGKTCVKLRLATTKKWTDNNGEEKEKTQWHTLVFWREKVQKVILDYVSKGSKLYAEGEIVYSTQEMDDGSTRYFTEIEVSDFTLLPSANDSESRDAPKSKPKPAREPQNESFDDDDIPF